MRLPTELVPLRRSDRFVCTWAPPEPVGPKRTVRVLGVEPRVGQNADRLELSTKIIWISGSDTPGNSGTKLRNKWSYP